MENLRILPPALKDIRAYTFLLKRSNIGRVDATTRSFHGVSGGCCDIIPSVYIASVSVSTTSRESRCYARTHTRASTAGRAARNTGSTGIKAPSLEAGAVQRGAVPLVRSAWALTGTYTHPREHARKARAEARTVGGLWCGRRSAAFANPNTFIYVPCSAFSFFSLFLSVSSYVSFDRPLWSSLSLSLWGSMCSLFPHSRNIPNISYGYLINDAVSLGCLCDIIWTFLGCIFMH